MAVKTTTSLAVKAFQLSVAAAQDPPAIEHWDYLEHIEAPQWVDLSWEASLEGTEGDDPWFYKHHVHHETPLEDLVFTPRQKANGKSRKRIESTVDLDEDFDFKTDPHKADDSEQQKLHEHQVWPRIKAKRVQLLPDCAARNEALKQDHRNENQISPAQRPSNSFSAKLLSTLMARLRTNEEMQATPDSGNVNSLSDSKMRSSEAASPDTQAIGLNVRSVKLRASIATVQTIRDTSKSVEQENADSKCDKENKNSSRPAKVRTTAQLNETKKSKAVNGRKSIASFDFGKNANGVFSVGRNDAGDVPRGRLSCSSKSPRLKNGFKIGKPKPSRTSGERGEVRTNKVASKSLKLADSDLGCKARTLGAGGDDLAALIAKHNSKFRPKPKYEPRLHSTRDIREWERRTGLQYYSLQPVDRVKVNQEIGDFKRARIP